MRQILYLDSIDEQENALMKLKAEYFTGLEQRAFDYIKKTVASGEKVTPFTVPNTIFEKIHDAEHEAGFEYYVTEHEEYIESLVEIYRKRELIEICESVLRRVSENKAQSLMVDIMNRGEQLVREEGAGKDSMDTFEQEFFDMVMRTGEGREDWMTGVSQLDEMTGGIYAGYWLVGAKSSTGKTAFTLKLTNRLINHGLKVLYVTLETSKQGILKRLTASRAKIESSKFKNYSLTEDEKQMLMDDYEELKNSGNLFVNDSIRTPNELKIRIKQLQPDVVFVDYLQLMSSDSIEKSREREIGSISGEIKRMVLDFDLPIVMLTQLNDKSGGFRPTGENDVRESAKPFQDADVVIYLHRPNNKEWHDHVERYGFEDIVRESKNTRFTEIILVKQKDGETGTINGFFYKDVQNFAGVPSKYYHAGGRKRKGD